MLYNVDIYSHFYRLYRESLNEYREYCMSILTCLCVGKNSNYYMMERVTDVNVPLLWVVLEPMNIQTWISPAMPVANGD